MAIELGAERVDDALELGTVRSARQVHLNDSRLLANDVESAVCRRSRQHKCCYNRGDHRQGRNRDRQLAVLGLVVDTSFAIRVHGTV